MEIKTELRKLIKLYLLKLGYYSFNFIEGRNGLGVIAKSRTYSKYFPMGILCAEIFKWEN